MSDDAGTFGLLLAFDRDGSDFIDGFEMGRLWNRAQTEPEEFGEIVHARNAEMVMRIAEATNREFESTDLDDAFVDVEFGPRAA